MQHCSKCILVRVQWIMTNGVLVWFVKNCPSGMSTAERMTPQRHNCWLIYPVIYPLSHSTGLPKCLKRFCPTDADSEGTFNEVLQTVDRHSLVISSWQQFTMSDTPMTNETTGSWCWLSGQTASSREIVVIIIKCLCRQTACLWSHMAVYIWEWNVFTFKW